MLEGIVGKLRHEPLQLLHPRGSKHQVLPETSTLRKKHTPTQSVSTRLSCEKVDEGIAYIGAILRVHGQVEKVIAAFESRKVDLLQEARL